MHNCPEKTVNLRTLILQTGESDPNAWAWKTLAAPWTCLRCGTVTHHVTRSCICLPCANGRNPSRQVLAAPKEETHA